MADRAAGWLWSTVLGSGSYGWGGVVRAIWEPGWEPGRDRRDRHHLEAVPTISRFFGITITMYFDDHEPAHFHARHASGGGKVRIDTLEVIDSGLGRRQLRLVLAWAELHQHELAENWRRARMGETLASIEPLR